MFPLRTNAARTRDFSGFKAETVPTPSPPRRFSDEDLDDHGCPADQRLARGETETDSAPRFSFVFQIAAAVGILIMIVYGLKQLP